MTAQERREKLLDWMLVSQTRAQTAHQIIYHVGAYDDEKHREARCFDDLLALQREGKVRRLPLSRPARWEGYVMDTTRRSACCDAEVEVYGSREGTCCYVCLACRRPCDTRPVSEEAQND